MRSAWGHDEDLCRLGYLWGGPHELFLEACVPHQIAAGFVILSISFLSLQIIWRIFWIISLFLLVKMETINWKLITITLNCLFNSYFLYMIGTLGMFKNLNFAKGVPFLLQSGLERSCSLENEHLFAAVCKC